MALDNGPGQLDKFINTVPLLYASIAVPLSFFVTVDKLKDILIYWDYNLTILSSKINRGVV